MLEVEFGDRLWFIFKGTTLRVCCKQYVVRSLRYSLATQTLNPVSASPWSKQLFHTSQNRPSFCAFYWVTTFSSAKRVSGWPRERIIGGVTGELRRLGLNGFGSPPAPLPQPSCFPRWYALTATGIRANATACFQGLCKRVQFFITGTGCMVFSELRD